MPSNARAFFDEILGQSDRYAFIESLVTDPPSRFETEWLDFKGRCHPNDVLKTWSESVSGFANTEGGVLIWGIDCRKVDGVDAANEVLPIDNPLALKSQLHTNINQTTDPPVQGIEIEVVEQNEKGFVVCYVPESPTRPHRAEQAKNKPYMIRCGDSTLPPSPSLLRSLFFPQMKAAFRISVRCRWEETTKDFADPSPNEIELICNVFIENVGTASAENLYVSYRHLSGRKHSWDTSNGDWRKRNTGSNQWWAASFFDVLHPSMKSEMVFLSTMMPAGIDSSRRLTPWIEKPLRIEFQVYAKNMESKQYVVDLGDDAIFFRQDVDAILITS